MAGNPRLGQHEILGPVLSIIKAGDFEEAVEIFNATDYGLTGGLFSSSRQRIERARREFEVGNLDNNWETAGGGSGFNLSASLNYREPTPRLAGQII